jgi:hypothetical protein
VEEHRRTQRQRVYKAAQIAFNNRQASIDCVVRNLSNGGALLEVASPVGIPDWFDLIVGGKAVVPFKEKRIGVEFH